MMKIKKGNGGVFLKILTIHLIMLFLIHPFYFVSIYKIESILYATLPIAYIFWYVISKKRMSRSFIIGIIWLIGVLLLALLSVLINGGTDFSYIIEFVKNTIKIASFIAIYLFISDTRKRIPGFPSYIEVFLNAIVIYVLSTIFFVLFPDLKVAWLQIIGVNDEVFGYYYVMGYVTRFCIAGWSSFHGALLISMGFLAFLVSYKCKIITGKKSLIYLSALLLGSVFYGRFGILAVVILLLCYLILFVDIKILSKISKYFILIIAMLIVVVVYFKDNTDIQHYLNWLNEPLRYLSGNVTSEDSGSLDGLSSMWSSFDLSIRDFILGSGNWMTSDGGYYMSVDSGLLRNIAFGGIVFCIYYYMGIATFIAKMTKSINSKKWIRWFTVFLIYFLIAEYKGNVGFYFLKLMVPFYLFLINARNSKCIY